MFSFFAPYISYIKWAGIAILVLLLGIQTLRVSNRDTTIAEMDTIIYRDNATITLLQEDQEKKKTALEALEIKAAADQASFNLWKKNNTKITTVVNRFVSVPAAQAIKNKEVLDENSSAAAVTAYNSILDGLLH